MPTYDYRCERCHEQFELWQSFSDNTLATCPVLGGPAACESPGQGTIKKVFSKVGIAFKGDGFYKNDHGVNAEGRSKKSEDSKPSDSKAAKSEGQKSNSTKSDSTKSDSSSSGGAGTKSGDSGSSKKTAESKSGASSPS